MVSQQPRFDVNEDPNDFFISILNVVNEMEEKEPVYSADSRKRDDWLRKFVAREPHLNGILNSATAIDKNRGWSVVGGRNQVKRISDMFHRFNVAPGLRGWRPACGAMSSSFWGTNIGSIIEIGREFVDGPASEFYTVDPTKCSLSSDMDYPLKYFPKGTKMQKWKDTDFFRVTSTVSTYDEFNGLGFCAVDRAVQIAQIMIALFRHDEEKLLARAPRGLLLLSGIKREQWEKAMESRDTELNSEGMKYFGSVAVLASSASSVEAKMVALSELPTSFNLKEWMDMTMYGYSLCFGYDPSEFWPVQYGALGRGNEVQIQHEKATGKGRLEFVLGFQEQVQEALPPTIDYLMEQRDDQGDLLRASVDLAWSTVVDKLYTSVSDGGLPLITNEEARMKLAEYGVIPTTWSPTADSKGTDQDDPDDEEVVDQPEDLGEPEETSPDSASPSAQYMRPSFTTRRLEYLKEQFRDREPVRLAAQTFSKEPIVQYSYPANTVIEIWESGEEMLKPKIYLVKKPKRTQQERPSYGGNNGYPGGSNGSNGHSQSAGEGMLMESGIDGDEYLVEMPDLRIVLPRPSFNVSVPQSEPATVIVNVPEQPAPVVNIQIPESTAPNIKVNVEIPPQTQAAPVVHVNVPKPEKQEAPVINFSPVIDVPESVVNITNEIVMPDNEAEKFVVTRDRNGAIAGIERKE